MSRFWSAFWRVAGFLFLIGWLQRLAEIVLTLFTALDLFAPQVSRWIHLLSWAVVPIMSSLTFVDWRWGWKPDNAGLRTTFPAVFWLFPGLLAGALAAGLAHLVNGALGGGGLSLTPPSLSVSTLVVAVVGLVVIFGSELIYRGIVISRLQSDLSGRDLLLLAVGMPLVWVVAQQVIGRIILINPIPPTGITGLGAAALSVFLSLLFLRTDSVWLGAGVRAGAWLTSLLAGFRIGDVLGLDPRYLGTRVLGDQTGLLLVFGIPAAILLFLEISKLGQIRRPGGPRGGSKRGVYGKTVRGPWGPH